MKRACPLAILISVLAGLAMLGPTPLAAQSPDLALATSQRHVLAYLTGQGARAEQIALLPPEGDWRFMALRYPELVDANGHAVVPPGASGDPEFTVSSDSTPLPGVLCERFGDYRLTLAALSCPGEWLSQRGDSAASGAASYRLGWNDVGVLAGSNDLQLTQRLESHRVLSAWVPDLGQATFVQNGAGITAFDSEGNEAWSSPGLGIGELIDVADLDGNGSFELIYSPFARGGAGGTSSAPGELTILDALSGAVLWRYTFAGLESGISRERTAIASFDGGATQSIVTVLTYSSHVWRFDFSAGVRNGSLAWKSPALIYNAPYKRPLVKDLDGDDQPEVVADTYGRS